MTSLLACIGVSHYTVRTNKAALDKFRKSSSDMVGRWPIVLGVPGGQGGRERRQFALAKASKKQIQQYVGRTMVGGASLEFRSARS